VNGRQEKRYKRMNMGKLKWLKLWWQLYVTSLTVWDIWNFRTLDFNWMGCTWVCLFLTLYYFPM